VRRRISFFIFPSGILESLNPIVLKGIGPMSSWQIKVLYYGKITVPKLGLTPNLDPDLTIDFPYLGFLLQQGK
jgi:hypothetical protein